MRKVCVAGALAAVLLSLASALALGNTLSFRNSLGSRAWGASWSEFGFGERISRCSLTLEGSLHSNSIVKTRGSLVGYVTGGGVSGCGAFITATVLTANLPWHIRYKSFSGTLPNISNINFEIVGFEYRIRETAFLIECLYRSTVERPLNMVWRRISPGLIAAGELSGNIPANCGLEPELSGRPASFSPSATITLI